MKKAAVLVLFLALCLPLFTGCHIIYTTSEILHKNVPNEHSIALPVTIDCEDVYGLEAKIYVDRSLRSTLTISVNQEMSRPYAKGTQTSFDIRDTQSTLLTNGTFGLRIAVILQDGTRVPLEPIYEWRAAYQQSYPFTLSGSVEEGFVLSTAMKEPAYTCTPQSAFPQ